MLALIAWVRWLMEIRDQVRSILKEKGADVCLSRPKHHHEMPEAKKPPNSVAGRAYR